jgi:NADH-quinone oxidoreductase subunit E
VVNCVGACAMAPVVIVNDKYYGSVKVSDAKKLMRRG